MRAHRDRPGPFWHRSADFGEHPHQGQGDAIRRRQRRDGGRRRLCLRGQARAEPGDGLPDRRQRGADHARRHDDGRLLKPPEGARPGRAASRPAAAALQQLRSADQHALRRQPAEGRTGEMAGDRPATPDPRRTDARHRRAVEGRSACDDRRSRQTGHGDHSDLLGDARASRHVRPHRRVARRPSDGRVQPQRGDAGKDPARRDRQRAKRARRRA